MIIVLKNVCFDEIWLRDISQWILLNPLREVLRVVYLFCEYVIRLTWLQCTWDTGIF